jgi:hypothetical protein
MELGEERKEEDRRWKTAVFLTSISDENCSLSYLMALGARGGTLAATCNKICS